MCAPTQILARCFTQITSLRLSTSARHVKKDAHTVCKTRAHIAHKTRGEHSRTLASVQWLTSAANSRGAWLTQQTHQISEKKHLFPHSFAPSRRIGLASPNKRSRCTVSWAKGGRRWTRMYTPAKHEHASGLPPSGLVRGRMIMTVLMKVRRPRMGAPCGVCT